MDRSWTYFFFLVWISYLFVCGILLFTRGFLLTRRSLLYKSSCTENVDCSTYLKNSQEDPSDLNTQLYLDCLDGDQLKLRQPGGSSFRCTDSDKRVVLIIIDALRYDFARYDPTVKESERLPFQNRLTVIDELLSSSPRNARLFKFIANPPTTTLQRLKGLTTGSLPTFIDIGSNFAASEIEEDNVLDQMLDQKKKIVFMGDDTWMSLYPKRFVREYPFPSFNVWDLDTVDSGILMHLKPEIQKLDWSLLIAHFLGVDHCGHRYGPHHKEMTRKLNQMNDVIRDVISTVDNNTVVIVMGDHGMTHGGDHGGESTEEVTSALFMYSPAPFMSSEMVLPSESVYQVDIVPTLSALLGFAVPFSNLGKVILEALPQVQQFDNRNDKLSKDISYSLNLLQNNVEQMMLYINTYSRQIQVFSREKISTLSKKFYALKKTLDSVNDTQSFKLFHADSIEFLNYLREMCEAVWVQFDSFSMSRGLVLTFLLLSFILFIVEGISFDHLTSVLGKGFFIVGYGTVILCACSSAILQHYKIVEDMYLFTYVSTLTVSIIIMSKIVVQNWVEITNLWYATSKKRDWADALSRFIHVCSLLILFSNSFVVEEGTSLIFLLNAVVWLSVFNNVAPKVEFTNFKNKFHWIGKLICHTKFKQLILAVIFTLLLRISHNYWRCREEQKWCLMAADSGATMSAMKSGKTKLGLLLTTIFLALFACVTRMWLRSCGNLVGFSPMVVLIRYAPNVIVVCTGGFWVLQGLPQETRSKLFVPWQLQVLPWTVYILIGISLVCLFVRPMCVYVMEKTPDAFSVYGQTNIIPQLFQQIKKSIKHGDTSEKETPRTNSTLVYGLGTIYSSVFIMLGEFMCLLGTLLLGDNLAPSIILMAAVSVCLLSIMCFARLENILITDQLFHVPWPYVLSWGLMSSYFFYGTGHQPTFPGIHWNAAFVGTSGQFESNVIPSLLIDSITFPHVLGCGQRMTGQSIIMMLAGINTFCSQIITGLTLPLLVIAPFTFYVMFPKWFPSTCHQQGDVLKKQDKSDLKRGDLYLYEKQNVVQYAVFKLCAKYMLFHGSRIFCCMLAAAIHCRHLMVWMIFAPRFIFEAIAFFVMLGVTLVGHLLFIRVTVKVDDLYNEIAMKSG